MSSQWKLLLYPELRQIESTLRPEALRQAREGSFDAIELVGLAVALLVVVSLTRYSAIGFGIAERFGTMVVNFIVAVPLLLVFAGPFYVRRARRGLRAYIKKHASANNS